MTKKSYLLGCLFAGVGIFFGSVSSADFSINPDPIATICTPKKIYDDDKHFATMFAGDRPRFSLCGTIRWFHDDYVATVNFEAGNIQTYFFDRRNNTFVPVQTIYGTNDVPLKSAENIDFSPDGKLVALSLNRSACVYIYRVDLHTHFLEATPVAIIPQDDRCTHGVRFDRTGKYLICTSIRGENRITVYKMYQKNSCPQWKKIGALQNAFGLCKPKSIVFTKDNRFMAAVYAKNVVSTPHQGRGLVAIYRFDDETGTIDQTPISTYAKKHFAGGEDIVFIPNDAGLIISGHLTDELLLLDFDKNTGLVGKTIKKLEVATGSVSFPHGIDVSPDGKMLGVANYGADNCSIYKLNFNAQ